MCEGKCDGGETPRSGNRLLRCGGVNGISCQNLVGKRDLSGVWAGGLTL